MFAFESKESWLDFKNTFYSITNGFSSGHVRMWELDCEEGWALSAEELMLLNCGVGEDSWESLGLNWTELNSSCSLFQLCPTLHNPMDCSMPGFPVPHHLPEFAQVHVYWIGDAIQTISSSVAAFFSYPQSFPASGSFPMSWLFALDGQSIGASASVLPMDIQGWFPLPLTGFLSLLFKGLSRVFSRITVRKHQFFSAKSSLWSNSHIHAWLLEKPYFWLYRSLLVKWYLCFLIHCLGLS